MSSNPLQLTLISGNLLVKWKNMHKRSYYYLSMLVIPYKKMLLEICNNLSLIIYYLIISLFTQSFLIISVYLLVNGLPIIALFLKYV